MWASQTENLELKTRRLIQLNFNETGVSNLYKFMTVLKSEVYTNDFFPPKKLSCQSLTKRSLLIANCLIDSFRKLNKNQKTSFLKFEKTFYAKRKDHLWSSFSFRNKFYVSTQNVI